MSKLNCQICGEVIERFGLEIKLRKIWERKCGVGRWIDKKTHKVYSSDTGIKGLQLVHFDCIEV